MYVFPHLWSLDFLQTDKKHWFVYDVKADVMLPKEQRSYEEGDLGRDISDGGAGETYSVYNMEFMEILENDKNNLKTPRLVF